DALHALRQTLSRVRRALGESEEMPYFLLVTPQSIQFNAQSDYWLDVDAFTSLMAAVRHHPHRRLIACRSCMRQLAQAADLYRGELLHGFHLESLPFQEWLVMEREHLHRQAMEAFFHLANYHALRGEYAQAQHYARRQLEAEPWCEEAHRQLMGALASSGQRSAALAQYAACCRILARELGVEPEPETRWLYEQIRAGTFPPAAPPHNLPTPLTRFIGREAELERIAELLNDPGCRLLTLTGPGGVGKTRLALAAGQQALPYFPDGVWFVPLTDVWTEAGTESHDALVTSIAGAMGISFSGQESLGAQLLRALRPKEALLILDGFEHLLPGVGLILNLLTQTSRVIVLITSRTRLNAQAERVVQVTGLPTPPGDNGPVVAECDSVRLFLERAGATVVSAHALAQVAQVCRLVEGLPLAIELAAAWAEHLPPDEIVANLHQGLDILAATLHDIPERHRSIRAVLASSWHLLSEAEQHLLAQLSVFRGDFDRAAILAVTGARPAELIGLAHKSLVQRSGPDRYALHALVRQFAAEKLAAISSLSGTGDRHSAYYLAFVGQRTQAMLGNEPQAATAEVEAEIANIRQAWQWAVERLASGEFPAPHVAALAESARGLACFYTSKGLNQEGEQVFRSAAKAMRAVVAASEQPPLQPEALADSLWALSCLLMAQGHFLAALGDHPGALAVLQEADSVSEKASALRPGSNLAERATLLAFLGTCYNRIGDYAQAVGHLESALALARQTGDARAETEALTLLAQATSERGDYQTAQHYLDEILTLARARQDRPSEAAALSMLGSLAWRWGDLAQADACCQESLAIYRELGNRQRIPRLLNVLGILAILRGNYAQAVRHYQESLSIAREANDRQAIADILNNLGYIHHHYTGDLEQARRYYQESLSISREIGHRHGATSTLSNLGHLLVLLGDHALAWKRLCEALSEAVAIGVAPLMLDALVGVALLWVETGKRERAAEFVGLVINHPATEVDTAQVAERVLTRLRQVLPAEQIEQAVAHGKELDLGAVVTKLLQEVTG
ncbi:MAG: tetratricopeptide repeat protein, partial [Anaerolineae bacterium]|nr:tetratricopeptide repeat protein [Anaerolineae bacterium]